MPVTDISGVADEARNLADFMQEVLNRVISVYDSFNMPLPGRRYWTFGEPVIDCEQVVVSFVQLYLGAPGAETSEPRRCHDPKTAVISIQVARQIPITQQNGQPPRADDIQAASVVSAYDAWILMDSINLFDTWSEYGSFGMGVVASIDVGSVQGGFQSVNLSLTMAIP
jgi:hypothetical protein